MNIQNNNKNISVFQAKKTETMFLSEKTRKNNWFGIHLYEKFCRENKIHPKNYTSFLLLAESLCSNGRKVSYVEVLKSAVYKTYENYYGNEGLYLISRKIKELRRRYGSCVRKKNGVNIQQIKSIYFPESLRGRRDKLMFFLAFYSSMRSSELLNLRWCDLKQERDSENKLYILVNAEKSKTNQEGEYKPVRIDRVDEKKYCPYSLLIHYFIDFYSRLKNPWKEYIFCGLMNGGTELNYKKIPYGTWKMNVKNYLMQVVQDVNNYSTHSFRIGSLRNLAQNNPLQIVALHAGHKKFDTTLGYLNNETQKKKWMI